MTDPSTTTEETVGVILAGGLARRMGGGDKPLKPIAGVAMLDRVIARLKPQVGAIVLNANGDPARFAETGLAVVADPIEGFAGPLAGVLAGLGWAKARGARFVVSVAGDTPFFPTDLVARLRAAVGDDEGTIALAASNGSVHPVFGLWPAALADDLGAFLDAGETRKVLAWVDRHRRVDVDFPDIVAGGMRVDPFFNVNTPEDMKTAEAIATALAEKAA